MDTIPLLCKICPEQPRFSDVSHLLTHISSKGHLYQSKNAQLRSHHDPTILQQLEAYNEWYDTYRIEALLAQRIAQKDSKIARSKSKHQRNPALLPVKKEEPQQKPKRLPGRAPKPAKPPSEDPIDPQLSLFIDSTDGPQWTDRTSQSQEPLPFDLTSLHQARTLPTRPQTPAVPVPDNGNQRPSQSGEQRPIIKSDMDEGDDLGWLYAPSPPRTSYPDPTTLAGSYTMTPTKTPSLNPSLSKVSTPSRRSLSEQSPLTKGVGAAHFLKLKGPHYPGMALFDSASPNSQRLRNQKKEYSLLPQMEHAAERVKPMEQIYFPQWILKKERVITGNVESSPIQETTPKPKRRRGKPGKAALVELSTNIPSMRNLSQDTKSSYPEKRLQIGHVEDPFLSHATTAKDLFDSKSLQNRSDRYDEEAMEWRLNTGMPNFTAPRKFAVFKDAKPSRPHHVQTTIKSGPLKVGDIHVQSQYTQSSNSSFVCSSMTNDGRPLPKPRDRLDQTGRQAGSTRGPLIPAFQKVDPEKENVEPMLDTAGRIANEDPHPPGERVTQRYFSVSGNDTPQFFHALPPQMEFGGLADHRFRGSSFNPLNPGNWQRQHMSYIPYYQQPNHFPFPSDHFGTQTHSVGADLTTQTSASHSAGAKRNRAKK